MICLGLHSHFSLMQATASPRVLCRQARKMGYGTLALTDINNLYGLWPFLAACREEQLRPIIGAEIRTDSSRLLCLVKDPGGYRNLCRLISKRHGSPSFDLQSALTACHEGLVLLAADEILLRHCRNIGADTAAALIGRPDQHNSRLRQTALRLGIPAVAMADIFFPGREDYPSYRLLRAIDTNNSLCRLPRSETVSAEAHLIPPAELARRFQIWPESLSQAALIAERCSFQCPRTGLIMPPWRQEDADTHLRRAACEGAGHRYGTPLPAEVVSRLDYELGIIAAMGFSSYFLVVRDIVGPVARTCGRGSGAASLVAYCLGITNVCPVRHNLYFERFLNPGRSDPPDIDIDFAWDERDRVLASVLQRFGRQAAMVANHVALQPRMAIRETAKVFGIPGGEISRVTRKLPWIWRAGAAGDGYLAVLQGLPQMRDVDLSGPWPEILRLAAEISGIPRYLSVHPGGVIITPGPVTDYVPVQMAPKGVPIIQWEKDGAEEAGLVKIDLLGNRSLGVIRDAIRQVHDNGRSLAEQGWQPEDDPETRRTVARGLTMGCFYIESPAMRLLQQRAKRGDFAHLVIHSSIIRPAANEFIREYLRRLHGSPWQPLHPLLAGVLDETYGIMVYQEDVSRVAVRFGFSHVDADRLRKIMSKKDKEMQLKDYRRQFFAAAAERRVPEADTMRIWEMMMSFDGYSFCKPHSASYARVSFQAAYLKTHFPAEFMAAVISNQGGFYSTFAYVSEARRLGLTILPPDVNRSAMHWQGRQKRIRVGLMAIARLGADTAARIIALRAEKPFASMCEFLRRVQPEEDECIALIQSGALDTLQAGQRQVAANRSTLFWLLASWQKTRAFAQTPLFPFEPTPPALPPDDRLERLRNEYKALGFLCAVHPITLFAEQRRRAGAITAADLLRLPLDTAARSRRVRFLGWLITGKIVGTKSGEPMEFLSFEDETGLVECTFFPKVYERYCHLLYGKGPLLLEGCMEEEFGTRTLTVERAAGAQNAFSFKPEPGTAQP
jgi:DNA-directed DNA polymerase III PolC